MDKSDKIQTEKLLYYLFLIIVTLNYALQGTILPNPFRNGLIGLALLCALCCLFFRIDSRNNILALGAIGLFGFINYYLTGYTDFLILLLAVFLAKGLELDKIIKLLFWERLIVFFIANIVVLVGLAKITVEEIDKFTHTVIAYAPGYVGPNTYSCQVGVLLLLFVAKHRKNLKWYHILFVLAAELCNYGITKSRTALLIMVLLVVCLMFRKKMQKSKRIVDFMPWAYWGIVAVNFSLVFIFMKIGYGNPILDFINDSIFNGRIGLASIALIEFPITLFGNSIDINGLVASSTYFALDNGYTILLLYYGVVGFAIYSVISFCVLRQFTKSGEYILCIVSVMLILWAVYEAQMISLAGNFVLLFYHSDFAYSVELDNRKAMRTF